MGAESSNEILSAALPHGAIVHSSFYVLKKRPAPGDGNFRPAREANSDSSVVGFTFFDPRLQVHDLGSVEADLVIVEVKVRVIAIRTQEEREGGTFLRPYRPRRAVTGELEISGAKHCAHAGRGLKIPLSLGDLWTASASEARLRRSGMSAYELGYQLCGALGIRRGFRPHLRCHKLACRHSRQFNQRLGAAMG